MTNDLILIRFGELSTKGKNIKDFIKKLADNMKYSLKDFKTLKYQVRHDHIYIALNEEDFESVKKRLVLVPGIMSFSKVVATDLTIEAIEEEALKIAKMSSASTFKIVTRRINKLFPLHSDEINRKIATKVLQSTAMTVDVHKPELKIEIMIRNDNAYVYQESIRGLGGYPTGIAGKGLMLLSGGIDSPVAAYMMMKRGVKLEMIHFASPPYTSEQVIVKIEDLLHKLNVYQPVIKLYIVPFSKIQEKIYEVAGTSYAITIMRRMMLRIAERVARFNNDIVITSGESIGQVASQTLKSMAAIEECLHLPLIRPLATVDKIDIIKEAQKIDTFDISIRPYEDCCTIFAVKDPTTAPHLDRIKEIEAKFDFSDLLEEAFQGIEVRRIKEEDKEEF